MRNLLGIKRGGVTTRQRHLNACAMGLVADRKQTMSRQNRVRTGRGSSNM